MIKGKVVNFIDIKQVKQLEERRKKSKVKKKI